MRFSASFALPPLLALLAACGSGANKDPVAEARFQNEKRIGNEDVTSKQERDAGFLVNAASYSMLDTEMSQMALRKASSADVKYLAQMIIGEHAAMQKALQQLAGQKSIVLPSGLGAEQAKRLGQLGALTGPAFDRKYAELLEDSHKTSVDDFETMSDDAYDGDIRAFAANYLAPLKAHLEAADNLADKLPK